MPMRGVFQPTGVSSFESFCESSLAGRSIVAGGCGSRSGPLTFGVCGLCFMVDMFCVTVPIALRNCYRGDVRWLLLLGVENRFSLYFFDRVSSGINVMPLSAGATRSGSYKAYFDMRRMPKSPIQNSITTVSAAVRQKLLHPI